MMAAMDPVGALATLKAGRALIASHFIGAAVLLTIASGPYLIGRLAQTADGLQCNESDPKAVCFCTVGALGRASAQVSDRYFDARHYLVLALGIDDSYRRMKISDWHDSAGCLEVVLAGWDKAIAIAEKEIA